MLERTNPNFRVVAKMTEMRYSQRKWDGEPRLIDTAMLSRYLDVLRVIIYYVAGPQAMGREMRKLLVASSIVEDDVRLEAFAGY